MIRTGTLLGTLALLAFLSTEMGLEKVYGKDRVSYTAPVKTHSGTIRGEKVGGVEVYRGIPFAAPPVGKLRWRSPQPVRAWKGVRDCVKFGPACPQPKRKGMGGDPGPHSEDCLYLNVWTAAKGKKKKLPVMFWIHGGSNTIGSGSLRYYRGHVLAKKGVVVVTINYRLGVFGYFGHSSLSREASYKSSGNYGLLDQIAALKWVQKNISKFGGDPNNVTIFGESAGGVNVGYLLISPPAKGLFHRAIAQSGAAVGGQARFLKRNYEGQDSMESLAGKWARGVVGKETKDVLASLRKIPAEKLLVISRPKTGFFKRGGIRYGPIVDGHVVPDHPRKLYREGKFHRVPFIAGSTRDEGTMFIRRLPIDNAFAYQMMVRMVFKKDAGDVLRLFPGNGAEGLKGDINRLLTASFFVTSTRLTSDYLAEKGLPVYYYQFSRVSNFAKRLGWGAFHGSEIPYVFDNFNPKAIAQKLYTKEDLTLADQMSEYWINFARTGNPNGKSLPQWPKYHPQKDAPYLVLGDKIVVKKNLYREAYALFSRIYRDRNPLVASQANPDGERPAERDE